MESISRSHNDVPHANHFFIAILFAIGFVAARFFLDKFLYKRLSIWLLSKGAKPLKITTKKRAKVVKCSESMWKLTYYATVQACVLMILYHEPWSADTKEYFSGWPNQELKLSFMLLYMCQWGFYLYSIVALLTWETRRKDFAIMMSHHVVTVFLIGFSYYASLFRMGLVVLALHDASDVFMEAAKIFKYSGNEVAASVFFGFFAVSWFILRLIIFPFWIIYAISFDLIKVLTMSRPYHRFLYYLLNVLLLILLVFHIYWWILIFAMIARQLKNRGKVGEDIRSDSEDED